MVGDFNRVPCTSFRANPKYVLNEDDRALRRVCGFRCDCCAPTVDGPSRLVGRDGAVKVDWTHFDSTGAGVSRLDFGVEIGVSTGRWKLIDTFRPVSGFRFPATLLSPCLSCSHHARQPSTVFQIRSHTGRFLPKLSTFQLPASVFPTAQTSPLSPGLLSLGTSGLV